MVSRQCDIQCDIRYGRITCFPCLSVYQNIEDGIHPRLKPWNSAKGLEGIEMFSSGFGLAFQLHDDLLFFKTSQDIGKDSNSDAFNGNKIPIAILARQLGSGEERNFIDRVWGKPTELNPENLLKLKEIFKTTKALQKTVEIISAEIKKAKTGLNIIAKAGFDVSSLQYLLNTGLPWMDDLTEQLI